MEKSISVFLSSDYEALQLIALGGEVRGNFYELCAFLKFTQQISVEHLTTTHHRITQTEICGAYILDGASWCLSSLFI